MNGAELLNYSQSFNYIYKFRGKFFNRFSAGGFINNDNYLEYLVSHTAANIFLGKPAIIFKSQCVDASTLLLNMKLATSIRGLHPQGVAKRFHRQLCQCYDETHAASEEMEIPAHQKAVLKLTISNELPCLVQNTRPFNSLLPRSKRESREALQDG